MVIDLSSQHRYVGDLLRHGSERLTMSGEQLGAELERLGLKSADIDEAQAHYGNFIADPVWAPLTGALVERISRDRGDIDAEIPIWPDFNDHGASARLMWIYLTAHGAPELRAYHQSLGVDDDVTDTTLSVLARHVELHRSKYGTLGVDPGWWMLPVLRGEMLHIGSLQFHLVHLGVGTLSPDPWLSDEEAHRYGVGFLRGDLSLGLHIPAGTDLSPTALSATFARARSVIGRGWPAHQRRIATCQSWMMDDRLCQFLGSEANIVQFQQQFTLLDQWSDDVDNVVEFVFRRPQSEITDATPRNRLQRAVYATLADGGTWRNRVGWCEFDGKDVSIST